MKCLLWVTFLPMLASCGEPGCPNRQDNKVLSENAPESEAYQREMHRKISANWGGVDYYFEKRETLSGENFLLLNCYGEGFCGKLRLLVQQEDSLTVLLQNDSGYRGVQLRGLQVEQLGDDEYPRYAYRRLDKIVD